MKVVKNCYTCDKYTTCKDKRKDNCKIACYQLECYKGEEDEA